ncbi:MAG: BREX system ATP-binding protein BrxD [Nannocystaceae bacterium]|nr:BREX system ATP-binding protein BrxD [bacterium]
MNDISLIKRKEIIDALRRGTVPKRGLEVFAVGLEGFEEAIDSELESAAAGNGVFKAVRGEYGTGKTFFSRWLEHRARQKGFATALVQVSETDTPLHRMETVYRRALESLQTQEWTQAAFRRLIDKWFFELEEEALGALGEEVDDAEQIAGAVGDLLEKRLAAVSATQPQFAAALRAAHTARLRNEHGVSEGLLAWIMGQPNVGAGVKRAANLKGDLDHRGASGFFRGLLAVLRQLGRAGLVLVIDEVETIQRVRADSREKSLNAIRQLIDELDGGSYPGMYVLMTGTPQFYDGPQGVRRLAALEQRLRVRFDPKTTEYDNPRAIQIRLTPFDRERLIEVGKRIRDIFPAEDEEDLRSRVGDDVLRMLADGIGGQLGGKVGVPPRVYLRELVEVLDKVDIHATYDPKEHCVPVISAADLTPEERAAAGMERDVDDIELDLGGE